jgi:HK97 family phage portal protein
LQLREYRDQSEIDPAAPFVRRPTRQWTPGAFTRDTVFYMASRGEAIWLVMERDAADFASSIVPVAPESIKSEWDGLEHRWYSYRSDGTTRTYDSRDVIHIPMLRDPSTGRGLGPMQLCGVALNVAVEADVWASRFFVGSIPSVYLDSKVPISPDDAAVIKNKWLTDPPNVPKVGYGLEPTLLSLNPEAAQLVSSRINSRADAALMFGIPGRLLEYSESGSSITYANVGDLATELVRLTLAPVYLEQIEQAFSDLLARGHEVRYDVSGLERADAKTRYEIHSTAIETGIYTPQYAAQQEGIEGGSPAVVPVPLREVG